jgi:hypothetical protein
LPSFQFVSPTKVPISIHGKSNVATFSISFITIIVSFGNKSDIVGLCTNTYSPFQAPQSYAREPCIRLVRIKVVQVTAALARPTTSETVPIVFSMEREIMGVKGLAVYESRFSNALRSSFMKRVSFC